MLKLSVEKPLLVSEGDESFGWARYRIDFEDFNPHERYVLGWISPAYPKIEFQERLYDIDGWQEGMVREIKQGNVRMVQKFTVRLYREGLINGNFKEPHLILIEEKSY